jgi:hypothetical protein
MTFLNKFKLSNFKKLSLKLKILIAILIIPASILAFKGSVSAYEIYLRLFDKEFVNVSSNIRLKMVKE